MNVQPHTVNQDEGFGLMTFAEAAAILHHGIKPSTLHKARRDGRLRAVHVGKNYYTTKQWLWEYLNCPDAENRPASISETTNSNGSFVTAASNGGQASALASLQKLKRHSLNMSQESKPPPGVALPIRGN